MAIQSTLEKESGTTDVPQIPVLVYDDAGAAVDIVSAIAAAQAAAPATFFGLPQDTPRFKRLSNGSARVTIPYKLLNIKHITPVIPDGRSRLRFNFTAQPIFVEWAEEVAKFPEEAVSFGGLVNVKPSTNGGPPQVVGASIPVPPENLAMDYVVDIATAESYARPVSQAVGHVNASKFGNYDPGTLMMTSFRGQQRDADYYALSVGWSYDPGFSGTIGSGANEITGVSKDGHDYGWIYTKTIVETGNEGDIARQVPKFVYVNRVWPRGNLNVLGVTPP